MTPEQFVYWLQGYFELTCTTGLSPKQTQVLKEHLNLVFNKQTPDIDILEDLDELMHEQKSLWEFDNIPSDEVYDDVQKVYDNKDFYC